MGVDPEQADSLILPLGIPRDARNGSHCDRVIPTQHQGEVTQAHDSPDFASKNGRGAGDLREIASPLVTDLELLHVLDDDVTLVDHLVSQLRQTVSDAGDANGGGT